MEFLYPINGLFFYKLIFMAVLLLGEGMFVFKLEKRNHFWLKAVISILSCLLLALAFPIPTGNEFYSMIMFFVLFAFTYGFSFLLFKADWRMLLFYLICGYTTEHIAYEVYSTLSSFIISGDSKPGGLYDYNSINMFDGPLDFCLWIISYINIYWIIFIYFARRIVKGQVFRSNDGLKVLLIGAFFIVVDIVINSVVSYYSSIHYERIYVGFASLLNVICCVFGLLFIFEMYYRSNLTRDYAIMQEIRKEEKNQYEVSKETIDLINIKCHDFRHQIRKLGKEQNIDENAINNINKLIKIYDSSIKTSNNALNVILSEKSLTCSKYGINFSCIANGELLSFMSEEDIYSLFGNILDNAIEAVKNLNKDKKIITIKIKSVGNMISISERNAYEGNLELVDGLPKSKKPNSRYHGFGLKSIKLVTEKYNGTMELSIDDNMFSINLLFIISNNVN